MADDRKRTLILEVELPTFYCDDLPELIAEYGSPDMPMGEQICRDIGEIYGGLLTVEAMGEKDSSVVRVPVLVQDARIEDRPPSPPDDYEDRYDALAEKADSRAEELLGYLIYAVEHGNDVEGALEDARDWLAIKSKTQRAPA